MIGEAFETFWKTSSTFIRVCGLLYLGIILFVIAGSTVGGCGKITPAKPEVLVPSPGQSAVVLENISVLARIPAQGDVLYEGPVMIERGTVAIKPIIE